MPERYSEHDHAGRRTLLVAAAYVALVRQPGDGAAEVLLQRRSGTGYMDDHWALLAGHVDPGETAHEAATREVREEAGVEVAESELLPLTTLHRFERVGPPVEQRVDFFFLARTWAGEPEVREPELCAEMRWCPLQGLDGLPGPVVPHERRVLDLWAAGTLPAILSLPT